MEDRCDHFSLSSGVKPSIESQVLDVVVRNLLLLLLLLLIVIIHLHFSFSKDDL